MFMIYQQMSDLSIYDTDEQRWRFRLLIFYSKATERYRDYQKSLYKSARPTHLIIPLRQTLLRQNRYGTTADKAEVLVKWQVNEKYSAKKRETDNRFKTFFFTKEKTSRSAAM